MTDADERDVAGVVAPPPLIYGAALLAGFVLEALLPSFEFPALVRWPVGALLAIAGGVFLRSFIAAFRRAHTPVAPGSPTTALVTTGPYRITRNPAYLGFALLYTGIAILAQAPWAFVTLVPALVVVDRMVIAREERYLERRFGDDYRRYMATTRRWL
ncbi:MAG TPA: isoprenylcysteine carboxylmethyltransferase family protein [Solirubrobacterales bacterium]|nr:isoprenylcysteine carboxylmethyltransferase family protein [Solirubrobacterales bacterium]